MNPGPGGDAGTGPARPVPGTGALPVRRSRVVQTDRLNAVVVEIDATGEPRALAVLQAGLHDVPEGHRLGFGYDLSAVGLGAWIDDRRVRLRVWPVLVDDDGEVLEADPTDPGADVLVVDLDPDRDGRALADLARIGRLVVAGPDAGPVPLVLDVDPQIVREAAAAVGLVLAPD